MFLAAKIKESTKSNFQRQNCTVFVCNKKLMFSRRPLPFYVFDFDGKTCGYFCLSPILLDAHQQTQSYIFTIGDETCPIFVPFHSSVLIKNIFLLLVYVKVIVCKNSQWLVVGKF